MHVLKALLAAAIALHAGVAAADWQFRELRPPGSDRSQVFDVNNRGQVAVNGWFADGTVAAYLWADGQYTPIAGPAGAGRVTVVGLDDAGRVVGDYQTGAADNPYAPSLGFVFDGASYRTVVVPGAASTYLRGISADGRWVSGYWTDEQGFGRGFVADLEAGAFHDLSRTARSFSLAQGFSPSGQVVGYESISGTAVGFVYDPVTGVRSDGTWTGHTVSAFRDMDAHGRMAGWVRWSDGLDGSLPGSGVLGTPASFETIDRPGARRTDLQGLNDAGWISGNYIVQDGDQEAWYGFVAMPVPEPSAPVLMLVGVIGVAWRLRRR